MAVLTKTAQEIFAPTTSEGDARGADMGETQIWGTEIEAAVEGASAGLVQKALWSELEAIDGTRDGQPGRVTGPDTTDYDSGGAGTHTDPVTAGTVANTGEYAWSVGDSAWERVGDLSGVTLDGTQTLTNKTLTAPDINGGTADALTSLGVRSSGASYDLKIATTEAITATRSLFVVTGDANRGLTLKGNLSFAAGFVTSGAYTIQLTATGSTNITLPTTGTLATLAGTETLTNKTLTAPDINGGTADALTSMGVRSTGSGAFDLKLANTEDLTATRSLTISTGDSNRGITLGGNLSFAAGFVTSGAYTIQLTATGATNVTLPTTGTLATTDDISELSGVVSSVAGLEAASAQLSPYLEYPELVLGPDDEIRNGLNRKGQLLADISLAHEYMGKTTFDVADWAYAQSFGGEVTVGRLKNGAPFDFGVARMPIPAIEEIGGTSKLVAYAPDGTKTVLSGDNYDYFGGYPAYGKAARCAVDRPMYGATRTVAVALDGSGVEIPDDPDTIIMLLGRGQSLMAASNGTDQYFHESALFSSLTWMFEEATYSDVRAGLDAQIGTDPLLDGDDLIGFTPAVAKEGVDGYGGQDILTSAANYINYMAMKHVGKPIPILVASAAMGGATQAEIGSGSNAWANKLTMVTRAVAIAAEMGKRVHVIVVSAHGESNATTASTTYAAEEIVQRDALSTAIKAITGQAGEVQWVVTQFSSMSEAADNETLSTSVVGIQLAEEADPDNYIIAGPHYGYANYYHTDYVHGTGRFYTHLGEMVGRTILTRVFGDTGKPALRWSSVVYDSGDQKIIATANRESGDLELETTIVASQSNYGLEVASASNTFVTINDVNIVGNTVEIDVASDLTGGTYYLLSGMLGHGVTRALASVPRTNFADGSSRYALVDGVSDPDRMIHQRNLVTGT